MAKNKLSPEVADKYTLVGTDPGKRMYAGFGILDFTSMELIHADALYRAGFKYLKLKVQKEKSKGK